MPAMFNPPHPGEIIKHDILPALGISVTEAALQIGIGRVSLSRVINGKAGISTQLALLLEDWLDGPSAELFLGMQRDYDLWVARNSLRQQGAGT